MMYVVIYYQTAKVPSYFAFCQFHNSQQFNRKAEIMTTTALEPVTNAVPAHSKDDRLREYCCKLFRAFRQMFSAETVTERFVFWKETKGNKAIVRLVSDLNRKGKASDKLVGITIDDLSAVKVLIGNFAAGCKLSTVRWELYADFDLSVLLDMGRFDSFDLFEGLDRDKAQSLVRQGIVPTGDWDFDAIITMHQCPKCHQIFDRTSVLYRPLRSCETCGKEQTFAEQRVIVLKLLTNSKTALRRLGQTHFVRDQREQLPIQHYLDPIANSVSYWAICDTLASNKPLGEFMATLSGQYEQFRELFNRSLFRLMTVSDTQNFQEYFRQCIEQTSGNDGIMFVASLKRLSEALAFPDKFSASADSAWLRDLDIKMIRDFLPDIINEIILNHKTIKLTKRKETHEH